VAESDGLENRCDISQTLVNSSTYDKSDSNYDEIQTNDPVLRSLNKVWTTLPERIRKGIAMLAGIDDGKNG
jgi:hypothetical protein